MQYTEIRVELAQDRAQTLSDWLCEEGLGYQEADHTTLDPPPPGKVRFHLYVPPAETAPVLAGLREVLGAAPDQPDPDGGSITLVPRDEDEWRDAWKRYFATRHIGRLAIVPSWEEQAHHAQPGEVVLRLDPGRAFGTGGHPSTRLCLRLLEGLSAGAAPLGQVLDVGCGCGVLAIAALRFDPAARGVAIDIDPEAVEVTKENADRNGVSARLDISDTALESLSRRGDRFDVVLANLSGPTLLSVATALAGRVGAGGRLIVSGILTSEAAEVAGRYAEEGLVQRRHETEEEWSALELCRPQCRVVSAT